MAAYFLLANLYAILVFGLYTWFLKERKNHSWSRFFLLTGTILCLLLPVIKLDLSFLSTPAIGTVVAMLPEIDILSSSDTGVQQSFNWFFYAYLFGCAVQFVLFVCRLWAIYRFMRRQQYRQMDGYMLATGTLAGPAGFGNRIFFPGQLVDAAILRHELAHMRSKHYLDKLLFGLLTCFFYPVLPLIFMRRELTMVHEFEADAQAVSDPEQYANLLLNQHFNTRQFGLLPSFFHHPLKRRIMMLQKTNAPARYGRKLLVAASLSIVVTALVFQSNNELNAQQKRGEVTAGKYNGTDTSVYQKKEVMPDFPGGMVALTKFLTDNIVYPEKAKKDSIEGRVAVTFIVDTDGSLTDINIKRGLSPECDAEVVRLIELMPKWRPGVQDGKQVRVAYTLPINFRLDKN